MRYEWDSAKASYNVAVHGVAFETAEDFDWQGALILEDTRRDYGERRFLAYGMIAGRLHALGFHAARQSCSRDQPEKGERPRKESL